MSFPKESPIVRPRVCMSLQFPVERAQEVYDLSFKTGVSRHKLLLMAINVGLPVVAARYGYQPDAQMPGADIPAADLPQA